MTSAGQEGAAEAGAAPPSAAATAAAEEDEPSTSIQSLPTEVEQQIFAALPTMDLVACMATCRAWRASAAAPALWQAACARRWQHGGPPRGRLSAAEEAQGWHGVYARRRQADTQAVALLSELQWPDRRQAAMRQLEQLGFPAIRDALQALVTAAEALRQPTAAAHPAAMPLVAAAAEVEASAAAAAEAAGSPRAAHAAGYTVEERPNAAEWPDAAAAAATAPCGAVYWARHVQHELCVQHCAQELRRRLLLHDAARAEYVLRDVAASAAAADAAAAAGGPQTVTIAFGAPQMEQQRQQYEAEAGPDQPQLSELSWEELRGIVQSTMEEGALALAQVHRPAAEFGWVRRALDGLGAELRRRIEAAGAATRLDKLRLLNHLLFGPGPPPRHRQFAAIPPPDGFGLEITGNRERYYEPNNSLLDSVLINREGIPISMAVLHAAVGARAGLPIQLLNVPMHVVTALDEEDVAEGAAAGTAGAAGTAAAAGGSTSAAPSRRYFIDVFDGGRIMDRAQFGDFLQGLGLPDTTGFDSQAMDPRQCWVRMCRNLLHIYREQQEHKLVKAVAPLMACAAGEGTAESVRAQIEVVNACLALEQYEEAAELLRKVTDSPYQVQLVGGAGPLQASALQTMLNDIQEAATSHQQAQMRVRRRQGAEGERVHFRAGQVMRHKRYHYRGVIVGWDPECRASEDWMQQMGVDRLPGGRAQPFYHVLPDPEDRPGQAATYVAQDNITLEPLPALHRCKPGFALHPEAGRQFAALAKGGACYLPNDWLRHCYPDDFEEPPAAAWRPRRRPAATARAASQPQPACDSTVPSEAAVAAAAHELQAHLKQAAGISGVAEQHLLGNVTSALRTAETDPAAVVAARQRLQAYLQKQEGISQAKAAELAGRLSGKLGAAADQLVPAPLQWFVGRGMQPVKAAQLVAHTCESSSHASFIRQWPTWQPVFEANWQLADSYLAAYHRWCKQTRQRPAKSSDRVAVLLSGQPGCYRMLTVHGLPSKVQLLQRQLDVPNEKVGEMVASGLAPASTLNTMAAAIQWLVGFVGSKSAAADMLCIIPEMLNLMAATLDSKVAALQAAWQGAVPPQQVRQLVQRAPRVLLAQEDQYAATAAVLRSWFPQSSELLLVLQQAPLLLMVSPASLQANERWFTGPPLSLSRQQFLARVRAAPQAFFHSFEDGRMQRKLAFVTQVGGVPLERVLSEKQLNYLKYGTATLAGRYFLLAEHGVPVSRLADGGIALSYACRGLPYLLQLMRRHDSQGQLPADDDAALAYIRQWLAAWPETESGRQWHFRN